MPLQPRNIFIILLLLCSTAAWSQPFGRSRNPKPYKWAFGLGWNFVNDDGRFGCQPFDVAQSWNGLPYPSRITVDRYFKYGLSAEFAGAYTTYKPAKLINDTTGYSGMFLSFDLNCRYSFYNIIDNGWLDPYASLGIGMTQRNALGETYVFNGNGAIGVNFWVWKGLGINVQTSAKYVFAGKIVGPTSYMQHSIGLMYRIGPSKRTSNGFSKKHYKWTQKKQRYKSGRRAG